MSAPVYLNGKFYSAQMTGVHRVAEELLRAMDSILADSGAARDLRILLPSNAGKVDGYQRIQTTEPGALPWIWWEQLELPVRARDGLLINLCNLGPLAARRAITMIHDAQIYISPESYSPAFVAWYRVALPTLGRNSACVLTVSEYSRQMLAQHKVAPAEKIRVLHNGVDHILRVTPARDVTSRLGLSSRKYVLALANTQAHKNIGLLFKAFAQVRHPDLRLVLIGGASADDFRAAGHSPGENVVIAGRVSDAELRGLMADALCFACPSLTEGFGLPPLEAMLTGCPAIAAPCGALPEVCGDAAFYAGAHDPEEWARTIEALSEQPALWEARSAQGVAQAQKFTWRKSAANLLDIIARHSEDGRR
jgi:glycosyltransferase involved in cell wall biosynthesis